MVKYDELDHIHQNMKSELQKDSIEILDIYVCPHHWDEGCFCRKPNPGMLFQASKEHLFRLDKSIFIGDDPRDCQAAEKAGCGSIFIGKAERLKNLSKNEQPMYISTSLCDATNTISKHFS
jgi:D-glycero-D-manno-heptose 1,7-bisphosphate phosphatase